MSETIRLENGEDWIWEYCEPCLLLTRALEGSPQLQKMYDAAFAASSGNAWNLVLAFDEFTPGSLHKPNNERKSMVVGFNFLNMGQKALSQELTWLIPVIVRSSMIKQVPNGFSHLLKLFLRRLLFGQYGLATTGCILTTTVGARTVTVALNAQLWTLLSDGDGLRQALDWKGAVGLKPCFKHVNVMKIGSDLAGRRPGYVQGSCSDPSKFTQVTRDELEEFVGLIRVAAARRHVRGNAERFESLQKALGINYNPTGFLFDDGLRENIDIIRTASYDWVHNCLQAGVVNVEVCLFLGRCKEKLGLEMKTLKTYMHKRFTFPKFCRLKSENVWRMFDEHHLGGDAEQLKCQASELIALYSVLRHFVETEVGNRPEIAPERASFDAACAIVDLFLLAKRGSMDLAVAAAKLRAAVGQHLDYHKACYGEDFLKPKHHWNFDVADTMERDASLPERCWTLIDSFVVERMHLRVRPLIENIDNTITLERSILAAVTCDQVRRLADRERIDGLHGQTFRQGRSQYAKDVSFSNLHVSVNDVVIGDGKVCAEVCACALDDNGTIFVVVETMRLVSNLSTHSNSWRFTGIRENWPLLHCDLAAAWYKRADDIVVVNI